MSCATPEERRARQQQIALKMEALSSKIKFYNYDDPMLCEINNRCQFIMSLACWSKPDEFDNRCTQRFLKTADKYGGDTYAFIDKPKIENSGLLYAQSEIFKCSEGVYQASNRIKKSFEKKAKYELFRVRIIPASYNERCNLLKNCFPLGELNCSSSCSNGLLQCHKYLQRYTPKSHPTYLIKKENISDNYMVKGGVYECPEERLSALPEYKQRVYDRTSDFVVDEDELTTDLSKIVPFQDTGELAIVNVQESKDVVLYRRRSGFYVDLFGPTQQLTHILTREMLKHGVKVVEGSAKTLSVSIDRIEGHSAKYHERNVVTYSIKLGNAKRLIRIRESASEGDFNIVINNTIARIAKDIMNDDKVRDYITQN